MAENFYTGRRVGSNLAWTVFSVASEKLIFFFSTIYLARVLGVENFGILTAAQILAMSVGLAVHPGISRYGVREIAKEKKNTGDIISQLLGMKLAAGLVVLAAFYVFLYFSGFSPNQKIAMFGCGIYLISSAPYTDWVFMGLERFKFLTYGSFISSSFFLAGCLLFVRSGENVLLASILWSSSYFLSSTALLVVLKRLGFAIKPEINLRKWLKHLRESIYFSLAGGSMALFGLFPVLILTRYLSSYSIGIFSASYRIVQSIGNAGMLVLSSFYPVLAALFHSDRKNFLKLHKKFKLVMLALGITAAIAGVLFGDFMVVLILGDKYAASVPIFKVLMCMVAVRYLRVTYGASLTATGFQRTQVAIALAALVSLMVLYGILPGNNKPMVMAYSVFFAELVYLVMLIIGAKKTFLKPPAV